MLTLAGCVSISRPDPGGPLVPAAGNQIVIGRIRVFDSTQEQFPWDSDWRFDHTAVFVQLTPPPMQPPLLGLFSVDENKRNLVPSPDAGGWFCWQVPPGRYLLYVLADLHGGGKRYRAVSAPLLVLAAVTVNDEIPVAYVGDLIVEIESGWIPGHGSTDYSIADLSVQSSAVDAQRWIEQSYPASDVQADAPQLQVDPELTGLFFDYSRTRAEKILQRLAGT